MTNPTSNFGWQMPEPTDLVTNLPADFEVFGQAVDTDFVDLLGGTTGQVLAKASNADLDFVWSADAAGMTNPMTTTGDSIYSSSGSTPARLGIGSAGQVLTVAAGVPSWATPSGGGATLLATLSLSGSSTASGSISGAYRQFQIYIKNGKFAGGINSFQLRLNGDTASNYSWQTFLSKNANELNGSYSSSSTVFNIGQCETTLGGASMFGALIFINRPSDTDRVFINSQSIGFDGGNTFQNLSSGVYDNSAAITSVTLIASGSTFQGDAYIYGVN